MREIKFRAWDKENKYMVQYDDICSNGGHYQFLDCLFEDLQDKYELMQFTGLTDKSGREIYESDRVKVLPYPLPLPVEFIDGCFGVKTKYGFWPLSDDDHIDSIEVIGTIYDKEEP